MNFCSIFLSLGSIVLQDIEKKKYSYRKIAKKMYRIRVPLAKSEYEKHLAEIALLNLLKCSISVGGKDHTKEV